MVKFLPRCQPQQQGTQQAAVIARQITERALHPAFRNSVHNLTPTKFFELNVLVLEKHCRKQCQYKLQIQGELTKIYAILVFVIPSAFSALGKCQRPSHCCEKITRIKGYPIF
ncbi:hypothetical protein EDS67_25680 [candidate division KSB1 bacterium]|nr:MAG: hypothetical protein EDS67_25680 [candidate division KSB1 bacterium]MBC6947136.1 hypothetical protein [candidate division KSB1 bacterium]MCE7944783.1 hypothetical protein [Chlorobi bacterium CHB1]